MTEIPLPSALVRAPVTWTLGHADTTGPLKAARGFVRFEASAIAVAYSDRTVLPSPVETPFVAGVMDPVDLIVNDPDIWNWKVTVKAGGVAWDPFHINVPAEGTNLASASITPGKGPVKVLKGDQGYQGRSLASVEQISDETLKISLVDPATGDTETEVFDLPRGPEGPYGGTEVTDPQVASWIGDPSTETGAKLDAAYRDGISVLEYGATGDGVANDTPAFAAAIAAADGAVVRVPAGIYAITGLVVDGVARLQLDDGATLYHPDNVTHAHMFSFSGTVLRIRGGTIDGNYAGQQGVSRIIYGDVPEGAVVDVEGVHFRSTAHSCCNVGNFGGYLNFSHNTITDQMEHQGTLGRHTTIASVGSGQAGAKGLIRTNHNRAIFDKTPRDDGTNPGGFFVAVNGYDDTDGGTSGTQGFANGNLSTWEAVGNYFYGYGQNHGGNDISPLHAYPAIAGARWVDNYFEACGFSAVSAKSVQDFVFTSNVIRDGMISPRNVSTEGAIAYLPGYQAASFSRPRAIISNNIVTNPGGSAPDNRQACLNIGGTPTSVARNIIVSGNVFTGGGYGVRLNHAADATFIGNHIEGGTTAPALGDDAVRLFNPTGLIRFIGNDIRSSNGYTFRVAGGATDLHLSGNSWKQTAAIHAIYAAGIDSLTVDGDRIDAPPGFAWSVRGSATVPKVGRLHWSNVQFSSPGTTLWADVVSATGALTGNGTPIANGVVPGQVGTTYQQLNGGGLWVAMGLTASSWRQVIQPGAGDAAPTMTLGAAAGTGASVTVTGDGTGGQIRVTTGTGTRGWAAIGSLAFATQRGVAPSAVILTPANSPAVDYLQSVYVLHTTVTRNAFGLSCRERLEDSTEYAWYYQIVD